MLYRGACLNFLIVMAILVFRAIRLYTVQKMGMIVEDDIIIIIII